MICQFIDCANFDLEEVSRRVHAHIIDTTVRPAFVLFSDNWVKFYFRDASVGPDRIFANSSSDDLYRVIKTFKVSLADLRNFSALVGDEVYSDVFFDEIRKKTHGFTIQRDFDSNQVRALFGADSEIRRLLSTQKYAKQRSIHHKAHVSFSHGDDDRVKEIKIWLNADFKVVFAVTWFDWNRDMQRSKIGACNDTFNVHTGCFHKHKLLELTERYRKFYSTKREFVVSFEIKPDRKSVINFVSRMPSKILCADWSMCFRHVWRVTELSTTHHYANVVDKNPYKIGTSYEWYVFSGPERTYAQQKKKLELCEIPVIFNLVELPFNYEFSSLPRMMGGPTKPFEHLVDCALLPNNERYFYDSVQNLVQFVVALHTLQLPVYIYYEILLWLNDTGHREDVRFLFLRTAIDTIQSTLNSIKGVHAARTGQKRAVVCATSLHPSVPHVGAGSNEHFGRRYNACEVCPCSQYAQPEKQHTGKCDVCLHEFVFHAAEKQK